MLKTPDHFSNRPDSPVQLNGVWDVSSLPKVERCFSMWLEIFPPKLRLLCCAFCKSASLPGLVPNLCQLINFKFFGVSNFHREQLISDNCLRQVRPPFGTLAKYVWACLLWPTNARRRSVKGKHLACSWPFEHVRRTIPLSCHHEQCPSLYTAERAGKAPAVKLDHLQ